jgi:hypothetical protein
VYSGGDADLRATMRQLSKKDETTKLKALATLSSCVQSKDKAVIAELVPSWCYVLPTLVRHNDRRVRQAAFTVQHDFFAAGIRKSFGAHLAGALPHWWLGLADPVREVAAVAEQAFAALFDNPAKRLDALAVYSDSLCTSLLWHASCSAEELSDMRLQPPIEEVSERADRVRAMALEAMVALLRASTEAAGDEAAVKKAKTVLTALAPALNSSKVWKRASASAASTSSSAAAASTNTVAVRRALYRLATSICSLAPQLCADHVTLSSDANVAVFVPRKFVVQAVFALALSESTTTLQREAWEAILSLCKRYPALWGIDAAQLGDVQRLAALQQASRDAASQCPLASSLRVSVKVATSNDEDDEVAVTDASSTTAAAAVASVPAVVDIGKSVQPRVVQLLRRSNFGGEQGVYASLLPLLSTLPPALMGEGAGEAGFVPQVLRATYDGLRNQSSDEILTSKGQEQLLQAVSDCCLFVIASLTRSDDAAAVANTAAAVVQQRQFVVEYAAGALCALLAVSRGAPLSSLAEEAQGAARGTFTAHFRTGLSAAAITDPAFNVRTTAAGSAADIFTRSLHQLTSILEKRKQSATASASDAVAQLSRVNGCIWSLFAAAVLNSISAPRGWTGALQLLRPLVDEFTAANSDADAAPPAQLASVLRSLVSRALALSHQLLLTFVGSTASSGETAEGAPKIALVVDGLRASAEILRSACVTLQELDDTDATEADAEADAGAEALPLQATLVDQLRSLVSFATSSSESNTSNVASLLEAADSLYYASRSVDAQRQARQGGGSGGGLSLSHLVEGLRECIGASNIDEIADSVRDIAGSTQPLKRRLEVLYSLLPALQHLTAAFDACARAAPAEEDEGRVIDALAVGAAHILATSPVADLASHADASAASRILAVCCKIGAVSEASRRSLVTCAAAACKQPLEQLALIEETLQQPNEQVQQLWRASLAASSSWIVTITTIAVALPAATGTGSSSSAADASWYAPLFAPLWELTARSSFVRKLSAHAHSRFAFADESANASLDAIATHVSQLWRTLASRADKGTSVRHECTAAAASAVQAAIGGGGEKSTAAAVRAASLLVGHSSLDSAEASLALWTMPLPPASNAGLLDPHLWVTSSDAMQAQVRQAVVGVLSMVVAAGHSDLLLTTAASVRLPQSIAGSSDSDAVTALRQQLWLPVALLNACFGGALSHSNSLAVASAALLFLRTKVAESMSVSAFSASAMLQQFLLIWRNFGDATNSSKFQQVASVAIPALFPSCDDASAVGRLWLEPLSRCLIAQRASSTGSTNKASSFTADDTTVTPKKRATPRKGGSTAASSASPIAQSTDNDEEAAAALAELDEEERAMMADALALTRSLAVTNESSSNSNAEAQLQALVRSVLDDASGCSPAVLPLLLSAAQSRTESPLPSSVAAMLIPALATATTKLKAASASTGLLAALETACGIVGALNRALPLPQLMSVASSDEIASASIELQTVVAGFCTDGAQLSALDEHTRDALLALLRDLALWATKLASVWHPSRAAAAAVSAIQRTVSTAVRNQQAEGLDEQSFVDQLRGSPGFCDLASGSSAGALPAGHLGGLHFRCGCSLRWYRRR